MLPTKSGKNFWENEATHTAPRGKLARGAELVFLLSLINCFFFSSFFDGALGDNFFWCLRPSFFDGALGDFLFLVFDLRRGSWAQGPFRWLLDGLKCDQIKHEGELLMKTFIDMNLDR